MDLAQERAALARVQTAKAERENAVAMGQLLPLDEISAGWADLFTHAKTRLLGIPVAVLGLCPDRSDLAEHVERLVYDAIDELADGHTLTPDALNGAYGSNGDGPSRVASPAAPAAE